MNEEQLQHWRVQAVRFLDGALPDAESRQFTDALRQSPELRRELAIVARQQVQLSELREEMVGTIIALEEVAEGQPRPWYGRWQVGAVAACATLLAVFLIWPRGAAHQADLRFASIQGEVWIQHGDTKHRAKPGLALRPGEVVQTGFGAEAVLAAAAEPTRLVLAEESVLAMPVSMAVPYVLENGTVSAVIAPQPRDRPFGFRTPQAEAVILGTEFHLAYNAATTHLAVDEGRVQLRRLADGASVQVGAGQFAAVNEDKPLVAGPSPPTGQGTGLLGEYFSWGQFERPTFRRLDPQVRFDWATNPPGPGLNFDHFQVRWTGTVQPKFAERYLFELVADDGVRLWVDGQLLVDQWVIRSRQTIMRGEITLEAGRKYDLKQEYFESSGKAFVSLYWQSESQPREIIPTSQLYPPATNVTPSLTKP